MPPPKPASLQPAQKPPKSEAGSNGRFRCRNDSYGERDWTRPSRSDAMGHATFKRVNLHSGNCTSDSIAHFRLTRHSMQMTAVVIGCPKAACQDTTPRRSSTTASEFSNSGHRLAMLSEGHDQTSHSSRLFGSSCLQRADLAGGDALATPRRPGG